MDRYAKAIVGALIAGLGSLQVALLQDGVTAYEWIGVAIVTLASLGGIWVTKNALNAEDVARYLAEEKLTTERRVLTIDKTLGHDV